MKTEAEHILEEAYLLGYNAYINEDNAKAPSEWSYANQQAYERGYRESRDNNSWMRG